MQKSTKLVVILIALLALVSLTLVGCDRQSEQAIAGESSSSTASDVEQTRAGDEGQSTEQPPVSADSESTTEEQTGTID